MKFYTSIFIMLIPFLAAAQGEGNVWAFGYGCGIDFNSGTAVSFPSSCTASEGTASVSTVDGELLFYSNGRRAWNREHGVMPGGATLISGGGGSINTSTQGCAIVPIPGTDHLFYIFSMEGLGSDGGLYYTIVDMTLDGGLGDVIADEMGILIRDSLTEKMTVVAGDCNNAWLIVHASYVNEYYAYEITEDGINPPVVSVISDDYEDGYQVGMINVSPDRTKMIASLFFIYGTPENGAEIYDFDPATGIISNRQVLINTESDLWAGGRYYGACFSPDGSKVYFSNGVQLVQFNFSLGTWDDIIASGTIITNVAVWHMKAAPDGKMYAVTFTDSSISVINSPNLAGTACDYEEGSFELHGLADAGLPNAVIIPGQSLGIGNVAVHDTAICSPLTISGKAGSTSFLWNTGATTESMTITTPGTYWVKSKIGCNFLDTFHVSLGTATPPELNVYDRNICPEQQFLPIHTEAKGTGVLSYAWGPAAAIVSGINEANAIVNTFLTEEVYVTVTNQEGLCTATAKDTIHINNFPPIVFELINNDTLVCQNETVTLNVKGSDNYSYNWMPEERVADRHAQLTSVYTGPTAVYSVSVRDANGCISSDSFLLATKPCCTVLIPNVFSPNGDGINDILKLEGETDQRINEVSIFNRLGERIFISYKQSDSWDGTFRGKKCDLGVYYYYLRYTCSDGNEYIKRGDITLLR